MKRRELLQTALGTLGGALVGCRMNAAPPAAAPATARPTGGTASVVPRSPVDLELTLRAEPSRLSLLDGPATEVWHFSAHLEHGMSDAVVPSDSSYLGPMLRVKRGQRVRVHFDNSLVRS